MLYNTKNERNEKMKKIILLYGFNKFQTEQVKKAVVMLNYEVKTVEKEQYGWLLGELIGEYDVAESHDENLEIPGRMMVVSGVAENEIANIFAVLRSATEKLTYHKAVVTPTNMNWTSARLFMEVDSEYREIKRRQRLRR